MLLVITSIRHKVLDKVLVQSWWLPQRDWTCSGSSCPPAPTVHWGGRTPGFHQSCWSYRADLDWDRHSLLSLGSCYLCWPHGDPSEELAALQQRPRQTQSPPATQLRIYNPSQEHGQSHRIPVMSWCHHHYRSSCSHVDISPVEGGEDPLRSLPQNTPSLWSESWHLYFRWQWQCSLSW